MTIIWRSRRRRIAFGAAAALSLLALGSWAVMQSGIITVDSGRVVGIGGQAKLGDAEVSQIFGEAVGVEPMSGGSITIDAPATALVSPSPETSLRGAYCYPSPFRPSRSHSKITFTKLTGHVALKVFDLSGGLVYKTEQDAPAGDLEWRVVNSNGSPLASGVYFYLITSGGEKKTGRFAVIR